MEDNFCAGSAYASITPDFAVVLQGYGARNKLSDGVDDPVLVGCLALGNPEDPVIILTFDMIGIQVEDATRLKADIGSAAKISKGKILISCSHSHFAPAISTTVLTDPNWGIVEPSPGFVELVTTQAITAVKTAISDMMPATLSDYRVQVPQISFNRRTVRRDGSVETNFLFPPPSPDLEVQANDPQLTVLTFKRKEGADIMLLNYGCHPVTGGVERERDFYKISADYISWTRKQIKAFSGSEAFFTLGAAGDSVPMARGGFNRDFIGTSLAFAALLGERAHRPCEPPVSLAVKEVCLDAESVYPALAQDDTTYGDAKKQLLQSTDENPDTGQFEAALHHTFRSRIYPKGRCTIPIQLVRVGHTVLIALPFEVFSSTRLNLARRYPDATIVSCANGYEGYLPPMSGISRGGYEVESRSMHFLPGTEERVSALIEKALDCF